MPARYASTAAEGTLKKLLALVVAFAAAIGVMTWYEPFAQGYELKNAAKIACNELIRFTRFGGSEPGAHIEPFLRRATQAGVRLKPAQYSFKVTLNRQAAEAVCSVHIHYPTKTDWALIGAILEIPPLEQKHVHDFEHRVRDNY